MRYLKEKNKIGLW